MTSWAHRSFSAGEITPSLHARVDTGKYATGLKTLRNMTVRREGGVVSRPGTVYVGATHDDSYTSQNTALVPYVYDEDTSYALEFSNSVIRVIKDGAYVLESASISITGINISTGSEAVFTSAAHGLSTGDLIQFVGATKFVGAQQLGSHHFVVTVLTVNTFTVSFQSDDHAVLGSELSAYGGSGITAKKVYSLASPFTTAMIPDIRYSQSGNEMVIAHASVKPRRLVRGASDSSWSITAGVYTPLCQGPTADADAFGGTGIGRGGSATTGAGYNSYKVTTIAKDTGEESMPWTVTIASNPYSAAGFLRGVEDTTELINAGSYTAPGPTSYSIGTTLAFARRLTISVNSLTSPNGALVEITGPDDDGNVNTESFTIEDVAPYKYLTANAYKSVTLFRISAGDDIADFDVGILGETRDCEADIEWTAPTVDRDGNDHPTIAGYNVYADKRGTGSYGWIGFTETNTFHDGGVSPDLSRNPPSATDPFTGPGYYPSCVAHYQQRMAFAGSTNNPERVWASKINRSGNFDVDYPITDDDAIIFDLAGGRSRKIQHLLPLERLVILTTLGEVVCGGDSAGVLTPGSVNLRQASFNGASGVPPLIIGGDALYVQGRGSSVRSLSYELQADGYRGTDVSVFSSHLLENKRIVSWCHQQVPDSIVWAVLDDGSLLSLTFMPEQQVYGWARHDTDGDFKSVCSVPGASRDVVYAVVVRDVNGTEKKFVEMLSDRGAEDRDDRVLMDSALTYDGRNTNTTLYVRFTGGVSWDETDTAMTAVASAALTFAASDVGKVVVLRSGSDVARGLITAYSGSTTVSVTPLGEVPASLRNTNTLDWGIAVNSVLGLRHLGDAEVSVCGDSNVLASPNNGDYDVIEVSGGSITLPEHAEVIHVGLPYVCDAETLDVDTLQGETILDKRTHITSVTLQVRDTAGFHVGSSEPDDESVTGLSQPKLRDLEGYDDAIGLLTGKVSVQIRPEWKSNGRVFVRHVDPTPLEILSIIPSGGFDLRRGSA